MPKRQTIMRIFILIWFVLFAVPVVAESNLSGSWRINYEETDKIAVKFKEGGGMQGDKFKPTISVMGLPLPSSYRQSAMSSLAAKDPQVLLCTDMAIVIKDNNVALKYDDAGQETLIKGEYRGRKARWSKHKIEQKYKTPERSVKKTWSVRKDGRLLVSVKINPRGDNARTYQRVFDRIEINNEGS